MKIIMMKSMSQIIDFITLMLKIQSIKNNYDEMYESN